MGIRFVGTVMVGRGAGVRVLRVGGLRLRLRLGRGNVGFGAVGAGDVGPGASVKLENDIPEGIWGVGIGSGGIAEDMLKMGMGMIGPIGVRVGALLLALLGRG